MKATDTDFVAWSDDNGRWFLQSLTPAAHDWVSANIDRFGCAWVWTDDVVVVESRDNVDAILSAAAADGLVGTL